jgi:hypothetical protein
LESNAGVSRLASVFDSHVRERTQKSDPLELGVIQQDMSLLLDRFPHPIPQDDYLLGRVLALPGTPPLAPGDRVLVAWVNGGSDPVIIDVVVISGA